MTTRRKAGWYWVKQVDHPSPDYWEAVFWAGSFWESHEQYPVVGPRIPTPDETWKVVPGAPTEEMIQQGLDVLDATDNLIPTYQAMVWAAPKPEDE